VKLANVGPLRERVSIQSQAQAVDGAGAISTTWTEAFSCWARMKPVSMQQLLLAGRDEGVRTYMMTIRYRTDLPDAPRVVWRGRRFDVQGVNDPTEQRQFLECLLREIAT
jgi:SPP1 family predicted phage head-tail adaptor